ncbi:MAG: cytidylate kinase-like family protein [Deltaproteobacteria bacterium]|nr:cytidylate kinase-like family protein [Deltaproteobacteria bacterium]
MTLTRRLDSMLHHQLARWEEVSRRLARRPSVAIASLPGAGGEALGRQVAERLGFACFGREIVDQIAERRGIPEEVLHGLDERVRSAVDRYFTDSFQGQRFTEDEYLKEVERFVLPLARVGGAVFVGRGTAFVLPPERTLRVLAVASRPARVERFAAERGLSAAAAPDALRAEDEARIGFIRHHFHERLEDAGSYDLSLNVGTLGLDDAAGVVVDVYRRRFPER